VLRVDISARDDIGLEISFSIFLVYLIANPKILSYRRIPTRWIRLDARRHAITRRAKRRLFREKAAAIRMCLGPQSWRNTYFHTRK